MISFLILEVGLIGVFVALDLFLFYIFWEIVLVPMYLIIGIWGGGNRIYATIKFVLYTLVGSLLMLVAILATAFAYQAATGSWDGRVRLRDAARVRDDRAGLRRRAPARRRSWRSSWPSRSRSRCSRSTRGCRTPTSRRPTAGSVILAAIMLKLGAYGFIRFALPLFPGAAHTFAGVIIVLSLIAIIYGAIVALVQPDLKKLVAYSSVSHMGFVTLGIFVFNEQGMQGAILQMVNHGLITGALFLLVGVIYERTHDRTIAKMGGIVDADAGLRGRVRVLRVRLGRAARPVRVRRRVPRPRRRVPATSRGSRRSRRSAWSSPRRYLLWMYQRVFFGEVSDFLKGLGHHLTDMTADRDPDAGAARRARRRLRHLPGPAPRPDRGLGRERPRRRRLAAGDRGRARGRRDRDPAPDHRTSWSGSIASANADRRAAPAAGAAGATAESAADRPRPRPHPAADRGDRDRDRGPASSTSSCPAGRTLAIAVALIGLAVVAVADARRRTRRRGDAYGGAYTRRRADDVPRPAVRLDRRADARLRARTTSRRAACRWPSSRSSCCSR